MELIKEYDLIDIEDHPEELYLSPYVSATRLTELIQAFISAQDVRQSSKNTYQRTLKQYFAWIDRKKYDLSQVARPQILEYKTDLLSSGLSALTVGSYISSVRRFYEWCESEKIYLNVAKGVKSPKSGKKCHFLIHFQGVNILRILHETTKQVQETWIDPGTVLKAIILLLG